MESDALIEMKNQIKQSLKQIVSSLNCNLKEVTESLSLKEVENTRDIERYCEHLHSARCFRHQSELQNITATSAAYIEFSQDESIKKIKADHVIIRKHVEEKYQEIAKCTFNKEHLQMANFNQCIQSYHELEEDIRCMIKEMAVTQSEINEYWHQNQNKTLDHESQKKEIFNDVITFDSLECDQRDFSGKFKRELSEHAVKREIDSFRSQLEHKRVETLKMEIISIEKQLNIRTQNPEAYDMNIDIGK